MRASTLREAGQQDHDIIADIVYWVVNRSGDLVCYVASAATGIDANIYGGPGADCWTAFAGDPEKFAELNSRMQALGLAMSTHKQVLELAELESSETVSDDELRSLVDLIRCADWEMMSMLEDFLDEGE